MDEKSEALRLRFFGEAIEFLDRARTLLADMLAGEAENDDIHELFRCIHSIKSEAGFLKLDKVGRIANDLEEKLEAVRTGEAQDGSLQSMGVLMESLEKSIRSSGGDIVAEGRTGPMFNLFEKQLLVEAKRHGESLYQIRCDLDPETPMKQARAYLILSNLEQIANVIRMEPSIHSEDDEGFATVTVFLTASADVSAIYRALDIDQIVRSTVDVVDFLHLGIESKAVPKTGVGGVSDLPSLYRVGTRKLNQMTAYADELKITLRELDLDMSREQDPDHELRGRITRLSHLANSLFEELRETRTAGFQDEFERLRQVVDSVSAQLGKKVRFAADEAGIEIDRRNLMALSDPLVHMVRNAVDHAIEPPEVRAELRKPIEGLVSVKVTETGDRLTIAVSDDGKGIDEEAIRHELSDADGTPNGTPNGTLLDLISKPGFSTLDTATRVSGRGVGLDLVVQRIESIGGAITLDTKVGKGSTFTITLPKGLSYTQLLFFRVGNELYAIQNATVTGVNRLIQGDLKRSASGRIYYRGRPAFSGAAPARVGGTSSFGSFAVAVTYLDYSGCFLADDVLFEHDVQRDLLDQAASGAKKRLAVRFGSGKREFFYLAPSIIKAAAG